MRAIKTTIAYQRDLHFPSTTVADASAEFDRLARGQGVCRMRTAAQRRPFRTLSNHMFHHLVQLRMPTAFPCRFTPDYRREMAICPHTRPSQLTNIFLRYPRVQFDLFHIGFPYQHEITVLAKTFPNVYVDFCWMHIVSPAAARAACTRCSTAFLRTRSSDFGGDYRYPELSYAHLVMARRNIATVLAARVENGCP